MIKKGFFYSDLINQLIIDNNIFQCSSGVALDGHLKEDDVNLASSTLVAEGKCPAEAIGIVVSYSVRVKLNCGTLGGELVTDVPFKLLHPAEGKVKMTVNNTKQRWKTFK